MSGQWRLAARGFVLSVVVVTAAACSGSTASPSAGSSAVASGAPAPSGFIAAGECPDGKVALSLLRAQGNPPSDDVIGQYEAEHPCVDITAEEVPFGNLFEKISISASSDNPPDIYEYDGPYTQSYAKNGILLPLDEYIPAELKADILPATIAEHSYQGKLYSPGLEQSAMAMFYNKTMLDKLGITPPDKVEDAWTWDEALDAFKACQQGPPGEATVWGLAPSQFGDGSPGFYYQAGVFLRSMGDPNAAKDSSAYKTFAQISEDGTTVDGYVNSPESIAGAQWYSDLYNVHGVTPKSGIPNSFIDQKACFDLQGAFLVGNLKRTDPGFEWGVTPLPYFKSPITHSGSVTVGVSAKSKHPAEAADFVVWLSSGAQAKAWAEAGALPALKSLYTEVPGLSEYPTSIFSDELNSWGYARPPSANFQEFDTVMTGALRDIALGGDPKELLDQAAAQLQPLLNR